eukprot:maker-scaffold_53-snap-gene-1.13-mRNA-1 protein AED:0.02 eAED:0.02 QI:241/1/1/1/1/1/3/401/228
MITHKLSSALRRSVRTSLTSPLRSSPVRVLSSTASSSTTGPDNLGTYDGSYEEYRLKLGSQDRREFTYLMLGSARFLYASAVRLGVMQFIGSMSASKDVLALATLEVELDKIPVGKTATVKWRGKPIFVKHRTEAEIADAKSVDLSVLKDKQTDEMRHQKEEWVVALAICTHLGCVPVADAGDYAGWFCPCHGSHYDTSGRIRKGPAPLNLEVPPYKFIEGGSKLRLG